jgi:hypothetical protein
VRGAGEATAVGDAERRTEASTTESGTSPARDWIEGDGRRDGVGFSGGMAGVEFPFVGLGASSVGAVAVDCL